MTTHNYEAFRFLYGDPHSAFVVLARLKERQRHTGGGGGVSAGFQPWRYVRPNGRRRSLLRVPGCNSSTVEVPSTGVNFRPGQGVSVGITLRGAAILGGPPAAMLNQSRYGVEAIGGELTEPRIHEVEGGPFIPGVLNQAATFRGVDLLPGDTLSAQVRIGDPPEWQDDPDVDIHTEANVSATEMTALIDVLSTSAPNRSLAVYVERA